MQTCMKPFTFEYKKIIQMNPSLVPSPHTARESELILPHSSSCIFLSKKCAEKRSSFMRCSCKKTKVVSRMFL